MFRNQLNAKIGNLLNYISTKVNPLSLTKTLKLLYLIDENAYARSGSSVTWLDYKAWEHGPVAEELYNELRNDRTLLQNGKPLNLEGYIQTEKKAGSEGKTLINIKPYGKYNLDQFTEFEVELIDNVIDRFGGYSANQLVELLHEQNTLWHKLVQQNNLKKSFQVNGKKSNHTIDFSELISNDPIMQMAAQAAFESMQMHEDIDSL